MDDIELSNSNNFKDYFRGLYVKLEQNSADSFMTMLDLGSSTANLQLHYTSITSFLDEDEDGIPDTVDADIGNDGITDDDKLDTDGDGIIDDADMDADNDGMVDEDKIDINNDGYNDDNVAVLNESVKLNFSGNSVNLFDNNYSIMLADGDMINGDEKLYLKGGEGSMAIIDLFGGVDSDEFIEFKLHQDEWIINEANLIIYEDENSNQFRRSWNLIDCMFMI